MDNGGGVEAIEAIKAAIHVRMMQSIAAEYCFLGCEDADEATSLSKGKSCL